MQDFAFRLLIGRFVLALDGENPIPNKPSPPRLIQSRRLMPSHNLVNLESGRESMEPPFGGMFQNTLKFYRFKEIFS